MWGNVPSNIGRMQRLRRILACYRAGRSHLISLLASCRCTPGALPCAPQRGVPARWLCLSYVCTVERGVGCCCGLRNFLWALKPVRARAADTELLGCAQSMTIKAMHCEWPSDDSSSLSCCLDEQCACPGAASGWRWGDFLGDMGRRGVLPTIGTAETILRWVAKWHIGCDTLCKLHSGLVLFVFGLSAPEAIKGDSARWS